MIKLAELANIVSLPIMLFILGALFKIGKAFVRHEKRHTLIASYIIQLCSKAGIKCKEEDV